MKTTLIFTSLLFAAALMGCSDNLNMTEPFGHENGIYADRTNRTADIVWELKELSVYAANEQIAENMASFTNGPADISSEYRISFDVITNADAASNGCTPAVDVSSDGANIYHSTAFPEAAGDVSSHVELKLDDSGFTDLVFQVALSRTAGEDIPDAEASVFLKLSSITVYRLR